MFEQRLALPAKIATYAYDFLQSRVVPQSLNAPEALPWVLYDTVTLATLGTHLDAFRNVNADPTMSNMDVAGSLPAGVYFDVHRIFITPLLATTVATTLADIAILYNIARGTFTFTVNAKPIGPFPIRFAGDAGQPSFAGTAAPAAGGTAGLVGGPMNGGFPVNGAIKLSPAQKFGVGLDFASTALSVSIPIQVALLGVLYRKIG
jgi:hypothetical protein